MRIAATGHHTASALPGQSGDTGRPDPPLSYLNYLHQQDRLYPFYYYDHFLIPRREYDHYCRWAAQQLTSCHFGQEVIDVRYDDTRERFLIDSTSATGAVQRYSSRDSAIGIGTTPWLPDWARECQHPLVMHSARFMHAREQLSQCKRVTVIGSGQSAAECVLALFSALTPEQVQAGASIQWITRAAGFHPMEYSKLGQECFTPAYMHYFHSLPRERRREIVAEQGLLYKGISFSPLARFLICSMRDPSAERRQAWCSTHIAPSKEWKNWMARVPCA